MAVWGHFKEFNSLAPRMKAFTQTDDYRKFYLHVPDANFSPARNKAVVEQTIRKHNAMILKKRKEYVGDYAERADAVVSYLRMADKKPGYNMLRYFEPKYLAFLRGDEIRKKLMANMRVLNKDGKEIKTW